MPTIQISLGKFLFWMYVVLHLQDRKLYQTDFV